MANREVMLTTTDNPFDPFTQWNEWKRFDEDHGYNSLLYLGRMAKTSHDMTEDDYNDAVETAIDRIVDLNVLGIYKKILKFGESPTHGGEGAAL